MNALLTTRQEFDAALERVARGTSTADDADFLKEVYKAQQEVIEMQRSKLRVYELADDAEPDEGKD